MPDIYKGNALLDGGGSWFFGDKQPLGPRFHKEVFLKYGFHHAGDECSWKSPNKKTNFSILIAGGPFAHSFKLYRNNLCLEDWPDLPPQVLEKVGDYIIYGPEVAHKWRALREAVVITVQFPPTN